MKFVVEASLICFYVWEFNWTTASTAESQNVDMVSDVYGDGLVLS